MRSRAPESNLDTRCRKSITPGSNGFFFFRNQESEHLASASAFDVEARSGNRVDRSQSCKLEKKDIKVSESSLLGVRTFVAAIHTYYYVNAREIMLEDEILFEVEAFTTATLDFLPNFVLESSILYL